MKKLILPLLLFFAIPCVFGALNPRIGYAVSGLGQSGDDVFGAVGLSLLFQPLQDGYGEIEGTFSFGNREDDGYGMTRMNLQIGTETFRILHHPFTYMFANNTIWSPKVAAGIAFDRDWQLQYYAALYPMHIVDVSFTFDFFSPYVYFNDSFEYAGWGIELMRISYYF